MKTFDIDKVFDFLDQAEAMEKELDAWRKLSFKIVGSKKQIKLVPSKGFAFEVTRNNRVVVTKLEKQ